MYYNKESLICFFIKCKLRRNKKENKWYSKQIKNNFDFKLYNFNYYLVQKNNLRLILYPLIMITNIREVIIKLKLKYLYIHS